MTPKLIKIILFFYNKTKQMH